MLGCLLALLLASGAEKSAAAAKPGPRALAPSLLAAPVKAGWQQQDESSQKTDIQTSARRFDKELAKAQVCLAELHAKTEKSAVPAEDCSEPLLTETLVALRGEFAQLKKWTGALKKHCKIDSTRDECAGVPELVAQVDGIRGTLSGLMNQVGVREPFTAEFITGWLVQHSGRQPSNDLEDGQPTFLSIKSRPFGTSYDQDRNFDFQFSGRVGRIPTLSLVAPSGTEEPAPDGDNGSENVLSTTQNAIVLEGRLDFRWSRGSSWEASAGAGVGQLWLQGDSVRKSIGGKDTLLNLIPAIDKNGTFKEVGVRLRYFHDNPRASRAEQPSVDPTLEFGFDYRRDSRFKLASGQLAFDSPQDRLVLRIGLAGIPVVNKQSPEGKPLTFGLAVEHEFAAKGKGIPSATRIFFKGDLELLKTFLGNKS